MLWNCTAEISVLFFYKYQDAPANWVPPVHAIELDGISRNIVDNVHDVWI